LANDKIQQLSQRVQALDARIDEGLKRHEELRTQLSTEVKFRQTWRAVSGLIGIVLLLSSLLLFAGRLVETNFLTVTYLAVMLLFGAILLFFAIAPERVIMKVGAFLNLTSPPESHE